MTIIAVNDAPTGFLTLTGEATENSLITVDDGLVDADGITNLSYHWLRNGESIDVVGSRYTLVDADVGQSIRVEARYTDGLGNSERVLSDELANVANVNDLPIGGVSIRGDLVIGALLEARSQITDEDGVNELTYQWYRSGEIIEGAVQDSYLLQDTDLDQRFSVEVSYIDGFGTVESVISDQTAVITEGGRIIEPPVVNRPIEVMTEMNTQPAVTEAPSAPIKAQVSATQNSQDSAGEEDEQGDDQESTGTQESRVVAASSHDRTSAATAELLIDEIDAGAQISLSDLANANLKTIVFEASKQIAVSNQLQASWSQFSDPLVLMKSEGLMHGLDTMNNQVSEQLALDKMVVGGGIAVSSGLSIGYVTWLLRSGVLLSSVLSSLPAWRFIDPLPVLSSLGAPGTDDDEHASLEDMVKEKPDTAVINETDTLDAEDETPQ